MSEHPKSAVNSAMTGPNHTHFPADEDAGAHVLLAEIPSRSESSSAQSAARDDGVASDDVASVVADGPVDGSSGASRAPTPGRVGDEDEAARAAEPRRQADADADAAGRGSALTLALGLAVTGVAVLIALFFGYLYVFTPLVGNRNQHNLEASLTGNTLSRYSLVAGHVPRDGQAVAVLEIPALHLKQVVVEGATAADLTKGPGLVRGTALPGEPGTAVIAGRRATYSAPFSSLDKLVAGDTVRVVAGDGKSTYRVTGSEVVDGDRPVQVTPTRGNRLLLVTAASTFLPGDQLVVRSELTGSATASPTTTTRPANGRRAVPIVGLAFGGDAVAGWLTLLWGGVFLAVLVATAFAVRRWRRPALTYRLAAPIVLACALLACECLSRWLPGTL